MAVNLDVTIKIVAEHALLQGQHSAVTIRRVLWDTSSPSCLCPGVPKVPC